MAPSISTLVCLAIFVIIALSVPAASAYGIYGFKRDGFKRETNADRLSRRLPPLRPRKLFDPSRPGPALARRSATPAAGFGFIAAYETGGLTPYCYLTNTFACDPSIVNTAQWAGSIGAGDTSPQNLFTQVNPPLVFPFSLYASSPVSTVGLAGSGNVLTIGGVLNTQTAPYAGPTFNSPSGTYFETTIWTVAADDTITAIWYNPTGSVPLAIPLMFFVENPAPSQLFATGDVEDINYVEGLALTLKLLT